MTTCQDPLKGCEYATPENLAKPGRYIYYETIISYIYGLLNHQGYLDRYQQFMRLDFPKIQFVDSFDTFIEVATYGASLAKLHLMQEEALELCDPVQCVGYDNIVGKFHYDEPNQRMYVNDTMYFTPCSKRAYEWHVGSYQVLRKYLNSYKGEPLDTVHYANIIKIAHRTLSLKDDLAKVDLGLW